MQNDPVGKKKKGAVIATKTNYDSLKEHNAYLAGLADKADALVKTFPSKAAIAYGKVVQAFMAVICSDNDIAFARPSDLTLINMIGTAYSAGVISKYEKGVLDDMRYASFRATLPEEKEITTRELVDKIINFFGLVMRYYHLEEEQYSEDVLPIGDCEIVNIQKEFELGTTYDRVYLASEDGDTAVIAQYSLHQSDLGDEAFERLRMGEPMTAFSSDALLIPEIIAHQPDNNIICVKCRVPSPYVGFSFDDFSELQTSQRLRFVINLAEVIESLHTAKTPVAMNGILPSDIWIAYDRNLRCAVSGLESRIGNPVPDQEAMGEDVRSFAAISACVLPEYEKIPVAGLMIRHALMGNKKAWIDKICNVFRKDGGRYDLPERPLKDVLSEDAGKRFKELWENPLPAKTLESASEDVDFDEMYSKVFN